MKKVILGILFSIFLVLFGYSAYNIYSWYKDTSDNRSILNNIHRDVVIDYIPSELDTDYIEIDFGQGISYENVVGYIKIDNTKIDYPYVQTKDNEYYLNHNISGDKNSAGWIFMDYRNDTEYNDRNTILYGHNMKDESMFGSLRTLLNNDFFVREENRYLKVSTFTKNMIFEVFSIYRIPTTSDYLEINFTDDEYREFLEKITSRSLYDFQTDVTIDEKIITLSTCSGSKDKLVVHAKLISEQNKTQ